MHLAWTIAGFGLAVAACAPPKGDVHIPLGAVVFQGQFGTPVFWDYPTSAQWASTPTLAVARARGVYPDAPDVELALSCQSDGALKISGDAYRIATDVGGAPPIPTQLGLRSHGVTLYGEPEWFYTGYEQYALFIIYPRGDQLVQLLTGDWIEAVVPFPGDDGGQKYPPPPPALANQFIKACKGQTDPR